ncbi:hypothetical protein AMAG_19737 [Allomyces macrogynus ATCC 38327]|uniref:Uncharacterized protein n=1 Tax=Allomyces macrogynus (strain ATCC 38327) TaxID=578462 RepID=A0A0L0T140_ALLM3|nr:hypothetical protein AMAG_19737 [Allomyces macrogynus ATCC 38327]|eukprot:KNE68518.1 hypothetical protein AMAG_19737 [Allomyces macrogynus ATCC 38327]
MNALGLLDPVPGAAPDPAVNRDALISEVMMLQENVKELLARLDTVKTQYESSRSENEMLQKYIQNLKEKSPPSSRNG